MSFYGLELQGWCFRDCESGLRRGPTRELLLERVHSEQRRQQHLGAGRQVSESPRLLLRPCQREGVKLLLYANSSSRSYLLSCGTSMVESP